MRRISHTLLFWGLVSLTLLYWSFVPLAYAQIRTPQEPFYDPLAENAVFTAAGKDTFFVFPHPVYMESGIQVRVDSLLLDPRSGYRVERSPFPGRIRFNQVPDSGAVVRIAYRRLPFQITSPYRHWESAEKSAVQDTVKKSPADIRAASTLLTEPDHADLMKSGSVFRGVSIGTDGMRLQSGLRLQVSGKITPQVEVLGSLTDQNTPIQPEGNTQTLQEIDKVFIQIKAPHMNAIMGDYVAEYGGTRFGNYSRKLQGAMGTLLSEFGSLSALAASSRGQYATNHFMGSEGNQGPYQLTGARGQLEMIVLAGSERVWVDGELMIRGEDNDFTIEYGSGQILFTRKKLITDDSRISVDFEYSDLKFQRQIFGAQGALALFSNRIKLTTSFLRESDDREHPLETTLTEEYRSILEGAGDSADSALVPGATYAGAGKGSYIRVDSSGHTMYQYVGADSGDYEVRFSFVGSGKGDYVFQGYGFYRYAGEKKGSYLPVQYLPLAESHQVADVQLSWAPVQGMILEGEAAFSDRDLNLYSPADDSDNRGMAYHTRLEISPQKISLFGRNWGTAGFQGRLSGVSSGFRAIGRVTEVEHGRKWGVEEGTYWGERIWEAAGSVRPFEPWLLEGEIGELKRDDGIHSRRGRFLSDLKGGVWPALHYEMETIDTESEPESGIWLRQQGKTQWKFWILAPDVSYLGEHRRLDHPDSARAGFRYDEWKGGMTLGKGSITGRVEETFRNDKQYEGGVLAPYSLARTDRYMMDVQWKSGLSFSLAFTHRTRDYEDSGLVDQKADLADMKLRFTPWSRLIDGSAHYRYSSEQVSQTVRDTLHVGAGLGNYRYDEGLGEYVPDPDGDVIFRMLQTGEFLPINDLKCGGDIRMDGGRLWRDRKGFLGILGGMRSRTLFRVERRDEKKEFFSVNRSAFSPAWGADTTTVNALISFYQDLEYLSPAGKWSFFLRVKNDDSEDHQMREENLMRRYHEDYSRVKGSPTRKLGIQLEWSRKTEDKQYSRSITSSRSIRSMTYTLETSYRPMQKLETALKMRLMRATDEQPDPAVQADSYFLFPRCGFAFREKGQLRAELEFGWVRSATRGTLPYELLGGDQTGFTFRWTLLFTYRITGHVMATLSYRGRHEPWRENLYQTGQVEVRAFF